MLQVPQWIRPQAWSTCPPGNMLLHIQRETRYMTTQRIDEEIIGHSLGWSLQCLEPNIHFKTALK